MKLKAFEHFNPSGICPVCETNNDEKTVLIPIDGTDNEGICEAMQVHLNCIELRLMKKNGEDFLLYQLLKGKENN